MYLFGIQIISLVRCLQIVCSWGYSVLCILDTSFLRDLCFTNMHSQSSLPFHSLKSVFGRAGFKFDDIYLSLTDQDFGGVSHFFT